MGNDRLISLPAVSSLNRDPALVQTAFREMGQRGRKAAAAYLAIVLLLGLGSDALPALGPVFWGPAAALLGVTLVRFWAADRLSKNLAGSHEGGASVYAAATLASGMGLALWTVLVMAHLGAHSIVGFLILICAVVGVGALMSLAQSLALLRAFVLLITLPIAGGALLFLPGVDGVNSIAGAAVAYTLFLISLGGQQSAEYWERLTANHLLFLATQEADIAREFAEQEGEAKAGFLASMSHEIRTPMNGVLGVAALLKETKLDGEQRELLETLEGSGQTLIRIVNDILDFSRVESGQFQLESEPFDPADSLERVAELLVAAAEAKGLALDVVIDPTLPQQVIGDTGRIEQILVNLAGNAVKFTCEGSVRLEVKKVKEQDGKATLKFSVTDTGAGIPESLQTGLFEPFSQAEASTQRRHGGSGLGLAICRRLANRMTGQVGLHSRDGEGSTFWLELSLDVRRRASDRTLRVSVPVQVVSRRATTRESLTGLLEWAGSASRSAQDLRALCAVNRVDLVLLELELEDHALAAQIPVLKATHPGARLVIVTAGASRGGLRRQIGDDAEAYLLRPVRRRALEHVLWPEQSVSIDIPTVTSSRSVERDGRIPRILIVEDHPVNQMLAKRFIGRAGYTFGLAEDGERALEMIEAEDWDAVLMDCQMPVMDGIEATRRIRAAEVGTDRHIPIIAMTANALEGDRRRALAAGMDDYLTKPLQPERMLQVLETQLNLQQAAVAS